GVRGSGGRSWIDNALHPERPRQQQAELLSLDQSVQPDAFAIRSLHIVLPTGQTRAGLAIAKFDGRFAVVASPGYKNALMRAVSEKRGQFMPKQIVNAHLERGVRPARLGRTNVGERRLFERELLIRLAGIATAEHFLIRLSNGFTMRGKRDVAVADDGCAIVMIRQSVAEGDRQPVVRKLLDDRCFTDRWILLAGVCFFSADDDLVSLLQSIRGLGQINSGT